MMDQDANSGVLNYFNTGNNATKVTMNDRWCGAPAHNYSAIMARVKNTPFKDSTSYVSQHAIQDITDHVAKCELPYTRFEYKRVAFQSLKDLLDRLTEIRHYRFVEQMIPHFTRLNKHEAVVCAATHIGKVQEVRFTNSGCKRKGPAYDDGLKEYNTAIRLTKLQLEILMEGREV